MTPTYFQWEVLCCYIYKLMSSQMSCRLEHMFSLGTPGDSTNYWIIYCLHRAEKNSLYEQDPSVRKNKTLARNAAPRTKGDWESRPKFILGGSCLLVLLIVPLCICLWFFLNISSGKKGMVTRDFVWSQFRTWVLTACAAAINPPSMPPAHPNGHMLRPH